MYKANAYICCSQKRTSHWIEISSPHFNLSSWWHCSLPLLFFVLCILELAYVAWEPATLLTKLCSCSIKIHVSWDINLDSQCPWKVLEAKQLYQINLTLVLDQIQLTIKMRIIKLEMLSISRSRTEDVVHQKYDKVDEERRIHKSASRWLH